MKLAVRLALDSLRNHKMRSRLSTIGVVVSVFLVSLIFIFSDSLKANVSHQVELMQANTVIANGAVDNSLLNLTTATPRATLNNTDVKHVKNIVGRNATVNSNLILQGNVSFDNRQIGNVTTVATSITDLNLLNLQMANGGWFDSDDQNKQWVVLGEDLANQLIGTDNPQSQVVDIKGGKFTVVGVIKKVHRPLSILGYNVDKSAFISLANGQKLSANDDISQIIVSRVDNVAETKRQVTQVLSGEHSDSSDYNVDTSSSIADRLTELVNYLTIAACSLAVIILLVSSISIANLMLVNVVERRREIGIRKAVGATTRNIMGQFMVESLIMSLRGGIIGLILAYIFAAIALLFMSVQVTFSWWALGIGFVIPIIIGVLAGIYPAYRASRQDIIEALNQLT